MRRSPRLASRALFVDDFGRRPVYGQLGAPVVVPVAAGKDAAEHIDVVGEVAVDWPREPNRADIAAEIVGAIEPAGADERNAHADVAAIVRGVVQPEPLQSEKYESDSGSLCATSADRRRIPRHWRPRSGRRFHVVGG